MELNARTERIWTENAGRPTAMLMSENLATPLRVAGTMMNHEVEVFKHDFIHHVVENKFVDFVSEHVVVAANQTNSAIQLPTIFGEFKKRLHIRKVAVVIDEIVRSDNGVPLCDQLALLLERERPHEAQ